MHGCLCTLTLCLQGRSVYGATPQQDVERDSNDQERQHYKTVHKATDKQDELCKAVASDPSLKRPDHSQFSYR